MTAEELGLKSRFKEAMQERLGKSGLIVEINGKYYLSEQRLREIQDRIVGLTDRPLIRCLIQL